MDVGTLIVTVLLSSIFLAGIAIAFYAFYKITIKKTALNRNVIAKTIFITFISSTALLSLSYISSQNSGDNNPILNVLPLVIIIAVIVLFSKKKKTATLNIAPSIEPRKRIIKETKCTCAACGNVWYYGKKELWDNRADRIENAGKELENVGNAMMCCGGCLPALFMPKSQTKSVKDLNKCPKCNSSAIRKEEIAHEV